MYFPVYFYFCQNSGEAYINLNDLVHIEYNCYVNQVLLIEAHHLHCILIICEGSLLAVKNVQSSCLPLGG